MLSNHTCGFSPTWFRITRKSESLETLWRYEWSTSGVASTMQPTLLVSISQICSGVGLPACFWPAPKTLEYRDVTGILMRCSPLQGVALMTTHFQLSVYPDLAPFKTLEI